MTEAAMRTAREAQGGDTGCVVSPELGRVAPDHVIGVHINGALAYPAVQPADLPLGGPLTPNVEQFQDLAAAVPRRLSEREERGLAPGVAARSRTRPTRASRPAGPSARCGCAGPIQA